MSTPSSVHSSIFGSGVNTTLALVDIKKYHRLFPKVKDIIVSSNKTSPQKLQEVKILLSPMLIKDPGALRALLLLHDADINAGILLIAIDRGESDIVDYFLELMKQLDDKKLLSEQDKQDIICKVYMCTPLVYAVQKKNIRVINALLKAGADVNQVNGEQTALSKAAIQSISDEEYLPIMKLLIEKKANVEVLSHNGNTLMCDVACQDNTSTAEILLKAGANINAQSLIAKESPLHMAVAENRVKMVKFLLEQNGVRTDLFNLSDKTPLAVAVILGHIECIKLLAGRGDINQKNKGGNTVLHMSRASSTITQMLLDYKSDPTITNEMGETPFHYYAMGNGVDAMKILLQSKIDIDVRRTDGATALIMAAATGAIDSVRFLYEHRANVYAENYAAQTALTNAIIFQHLQIVKYFLKKSPSLVKSSPSARRLNDSGCKYVQLIMGSKTPITDATAVDYLTNHPQILAEMYNKDFWIGTPELPLVFAIRNCKNKTSVNIVLHLIAAHQKLECENFTQLIKGPLGTQCLSLAVTRGQLDVVKALIKVGANIRAVDQGNWTLLMRVAYWEEKWKEEFRIENTEHFSIAQYLIEHSHSKGDGYSEWLNDVENDLKANALGIALAVGSLKMVQFLIDTGINIFPLYLNCDPKVSNFNEKMMLIIKAYMKILMKNNIIANGDMAKKKDIMIEALSKFILERSDGFFCTQKKDWVLNLIIGRRRFKITITEETLCNIIVGLVNGLKESSGKNAIINKIQELLLDCYYGTFGIDKQKKKDIDKLQEDFDAIVLKSLSDISTISTQDKITSAALSRLTRGTRQNIGEGTEALLDDYFKCRSEKKKDFEQLHLELENDIQRILDEKESRNLLTMYHPLNDFKKIRENIRAFIKVDTKESLNLARQQIDALVEELKTYKEKVLKLLKDWNEKMQDIFERSRVTQAAIQALIPKNLVNKQNPKKTTHRKNKGARKSNNKSREGDPNVSVAQVSSVVSSSADAKQALEKNGLVSELLDDSKEIADTYRSKMEALELALKDYNQRLDTENLQERKEFQEQRSRHQMSLPDDLRVLHGLRGGALGQISAQLDVKELEEHVKSMLESKSGKEEEFLERLAFLGTLGQLMEALTKVCNGPLPPITTNHFRDMIFYNKAKNFTNVELRKANENILQLLKMFRDDPKKYNTIGELLDAIENSDNRSDSKAAAERDVKFGLLRQLLEMRMDPITPKLCKQHIAEGHSMWKQCRDIFVKNRDYCNRKLLKMSLGFALSIMGNFLSHLRNDFKETDEAAEALKLLHDVKENLEPLLGIDIQRCNDIGKKYRHLNLLKQGDTLVKATTNWEQDVEELITKFAALLDEAPKVKTITLAFSQQMVNVTSVDNNRANNPAFTNATSLLPIAQHDSSGKIAKENKREKEFRN